MADYIAQGFSLAFVAWIFVWGITIPVRFLFKFLNL